MSFHSSSSSSALESAPAVSAPAHVSTPAQIEAKRAHQLLERAATLAERNDMAGAILAARQSLALAPGNAQGHAVLGGLLERANDYGGAKVAYEKSLQLAPQDLAAQANLARLSARLQQSQGAARQFSFDEAELYPGAEPAAKLETAPSAPAEPISIAPVVAAPVAANAVVAAPVAASDASAQSDEAGDEADDFLDIDPEIALSYAPAEPSAVATSSAAMTPEVEALLSNIEARLPPSRADIEALEKARSLAAPAIVVTPAPSAPSAQAAPDPDIVFTSALPVVANKPVSESGAPNRVAGRGQGAPLRPMPLVYDEAGVPLPLESASAGGQRVADRRQNSVPVANDRRQVGARRAAPAAVAATAANGAASTPVAKPLVAAARPMAQPLALNLPVVTPAGAPVSRWQQIAKGPAFYTRILPFAGLALLGLGLLGWALGRSATPPAPVAPTQIAGAPAPAVGPAEAQNPAPGAPVVVPNAAPGDLNSGRSFPITNEPVAPATTTQTTAPNVAAPAQANTPARSTPGARTGNGAPVASRPAPRVASRPAPNFPSVSLAPAPIPPAAVQNNRGNANSSANAGSNNIILPRPQVDLPAASAPPASVLPPSDNGLNPAGSPNRGFVRVEGGVGVNGVGAGGTVPSQPAGVARQNEQNAVEAARNGQTEQAINQLSQAIRADSDNAGFRYQQRAALFLQRGDTSRARDDYQSAISAYQNQIARGDNVAAARRGLNSARSGLNVAIAGQR